MIDWASGCGTADGASASDIRDPRFESGNRQLAIGNFLLSTLSKMYLKDRNREEKRPVMAQFEKEWGRYVLIIYFCENDIN